VVTLVLGLTRLLVFVKGENGIDDSEDEGEWESGVLCPLRLPGL